MEDLYYIQTPIETIPCNLRLNKKNLIMEQDDVKYIIITNRDSIVQTQKMLDWN